MKFETVKYLLNMIVSKYYIPIAIFDKKLNIIYPQNLEKDLGDLNLQLFNYYKSNKIVLIDYYQKIYSVFGVTIDHEENIVLLGPQYKVELNLIEYIDGNIEDESILQDKKDIEIDFTNLSKFIFSLCNDRVPSQEIDVERISTDESSPFVDVFKKNIKNRIMDDVKNDSPEIERRIIQAIVNNNKEEFNWLFNKVNTTYFARLHSDRLISLKYKYIALVTILTRVSINNGVDIKKAYGLSDSLIQMLESVYSLQDCIVYLKESCLQFMELINISKYEAENELIRSAKEYIITHINQKITVEQLAEYLEVSVSYVSAEFKKHIGVTIHTYILKNKIEEARRLLIETDIEISTIAQTYSFSDQSHFNRVFKQVENITPKEYRKKYRSTRIL